MQKPHATCPHDCPSTCALEVELRDDGQLGRLHGARDNPYTRGVICAKVARYAERQHHPERLTQPLLRVGPRGEGRSAFVPIDWDDALDRVAEAFKGAAATYGAESVWPYFYAGTMGLVQRDGIERLRHVMGYSRQKSTFCTTLADAGWMAGVGVKRGVDPREMADSDLVVVWGANPVHTQVNVMQHIAQARKARGTRLVVVDPYRTPTAEKADQHLMLRPGTDGALACAVMQVLFAEGFADRDYLARYSDDPQALERHLASRGPAWAAPITGLSEEEIRAFARLYGSHPRSFLRLGYGFSRSRNGSAAMHAVSCLPVVTGAWQHRGGGALYSNSALYGLDRTLITGSDALNPAVRELDQSRVGAILCGDSQALAGGPPVTAMLIQNTNPMAVAPESARVREGFARPDLFVCVHEQFMTETAAMADIVLPATTFLEHDDLYTAGGHTFLQASRQLLPPWGQARSNHALICALAARLGASHPGFELSAWELIDATLTRSGLPGAEALYAQRWLDCALPFEEAHMLRGFGHPDGRFRFKPAWPQDSGMPPLPDHQPVIDAASDALPFRLVTAPARNFLNSSFSETPSSVTHERRPTLLLHAVDAQTLGVVDGALVRIGNTRGNLLIHARIFSDLQPGVVVVEGIWPNGAFVEGEGINTLTSAEPGYPNGGAVFHDTAIWIRAEARP